MSDNYSMFNVKFRLPEYHLDRLKGIAMKRQISMYRLVAFAVDNELQKTNPFGFDINLPIDESLDFAYADEGGLILDFIKTLRIGAGLDVLVLLRYKIGVPNKNIFLAAFKELLSNEVIEAFPPPPRTNMPLNLPGYKYYRAKRIRTPKKNKNKSSRYEQYVKLKKEFKDEWY